MILVACTLAAMIAPRALAQTPVSVELEHFGVGSHFRFGSIAAIRVKLTNNLSEGMQAWVQWEVPNADGDIGEHGRSLALTMGQSVYTWLYAPMPPDSGSSVPVWAVRVFEERDGQRRGEVGAARVTPLTATAVEASSSMIAVLGDRDLALPQYAVQGAVVQSPKPIGAHENTRIAPVRRATRLPDRWYALWPQFEAIAWAGSNAPPQDLGVDQADALREYIARGGHLIISLPAAGNQWGLGAAGQTHLEDLLPCRTEGTRPRLDEAVPLADLLPAISKYNNIRSVIARGTPPEFTLRVFRDFRTDFNVIDNSYEPLIALPDGRVIAIQRWYGHGRVTVIGLDLSDGRLDGLRLPQADAFWNRILGRRCDTPSAEEVKVISDDQRRLSQGPVERTIGNGPLITGSYYGINMSHEAGMGLLLAFVIFVAYWLLAGPLGFSLLKQYGRVRYSWLAFAACAAIFTGIAWGSVGLLPKPRGIQHITFLDHVARRADDPRPHEPQMQRAVSYFSAYLPGYGSTPVSIDSTPPQRDLLMSWTPPNEAQRRFPNTDRYRVDVARGFANYALPSRATSTNLYANWMGGLDAKWGGMLRADPADPPRVVLDSAGNEVAIAGSIINELPGDLTDATFIWVQNNRMSRRAYATIGGLDQPWPFRSGQLLNTGRMWRQTQWRKGQPLDLKVGNWGPGSTLSLNIDRRYIESFKGDSLGQVISAGLTDLKTREVMEMLCIYNQLTPPLYLKSKGESEINRERSPAFTRELGRELDLSPWFNRPCLIVIGFLEKSAIPVPVRLGGPNSEPPHSDGVTVVRWIYPLPLLENISFVQKEGDADDPAAQ